MRVTVAAKVHDEEGGVHDVEIEMICLKMPPPKRQLISPATKPQRPCDTPSEHGYACRCENQET